MCCNQTPKLFVSILYNNIQEFIPRMSLSFFAYSKTCNNKCVSFCEREHPYNQISLNDKTWDFIPIYRHSIRNYRISICFAPTFFFHYFTFLFWFDWIENQQWVYCLNNAYVGCQLGCCFITYKILQGSQNNFSISALSSKLTTTWKIGAFKQGQLKN